MKVVAAIPAPAPPWSELPNDGLPRFSEGHPDA